MKRKLLTFLPLIVGAGGAFSSDFTSDPPLAAQMSLDEFEAAVMTAPSDDSVMRLERVYLREFTATIMETTRKHALIAGRVPDLYLDVLQGYDRCRTLSASLPRRQAELFAEAAENSIDRIAYFEHLLVLSVALAHMNRKLYELGNERVALRNDYRRGKNDKSGVQHRLEAIDADIAALDYKMNEFFDADPVNLLLTIRVGAQKRPFYQQIVADYHHLLREGFKGKRLLNKIREANQPRLDHAWQKVTDRNRKLLHQAWQHTCGERRLAKLFRFSKFAALGFYLKHVGLVVRVSSSLSEQRDEELLALQREAASHLQAQLDPGQFHSSAGSFFGMLAALTLPAYLVNDKHNKYTLAAMGLAGLLYTAHRGKALYDMRHQLEAGALSGLNSYDLYRSFLRDTSLSRTVFSGVSITALAMVSRKSVSRTMVKNRASKFVHRVRRALRGKNISPDTPAAKKGDLVPLPSPKKKGMCGKLGNGSNNNKMVLTGVGVGGSLATMFAAEWKQTGSADMLKDREFVYNMGTVFALDIVTILLGQGRKPYGNNVVLLSSVSIGISVVGHILSGKDVNWDRVIYDTTFLAVYSLPKARCYAWANETLAEKLSLEGWRKTFLTGVLSLLSSFLGNVPYSYIARNWVERDPEYHKFPLPEEQGGDELGHLDFYKELDRLLAKYGLEDAELRKALRRLSLDES